MGNKKAGEKLRYGEKQVLSSENLQVKKEEVSGIVRVVLDVDPAGGGDIEAIRLKSTVLGDSVIAREPHVLSNGSVVRNLRISISDFTSLSESANDAVSVLLEELNTLFDEKIEEAENKIKEKPSFEMPSDNTPPETEKQS